MAKLFSLLAWAGDKPAGIAAALGDIHTATERTILHGDRSYFVDTVKACSGKTRNAEALRDTLPVLGDMLAALRSGSVLSVPTGAPEWRVLFTLPEIDAATLEACRVNGKKSDATCSAVAAFASLVESVWFNAATRHIDAAALVAKGKRDAAAATKATEAAAAAAAAAALPAATAIVADGAAMSFDKVFADGMAEGKKLADEANERAAKAIEALRVAEAAAREALAQRDEALTQRDEAKAYATRCEARAIIAEAAAAAAAAAAATKRQRQRVKLAA